MKLCIDVGNTTINLGFYDNNALVKKYTFDTDKQADFHYFLDVLDKEANYDIDEVVYSSVVPSIDNEFRNALANKYDCFLLYEVSPLKDYGIKMNIDNPSELGSDLVADLVGAVNKYHSNFLIVDLGTAIKFLYVDKDGIFQSALITPGIKSSMNSLFKDADLLPRVDYSTQTDLKATEGKNTIKSVRNGVILAHLSMIEGVKSLIEKETNSTLDKVIITGGDRSIFASYFDKPNYIVDDNLVLDGELIILNKYKGEY